MNGVSLRHRLSAGSQTTQVRIIPQFKPTTQVGNLQEKNPAYDITDNFILAFANS